MTAPKWTIRCLAVAVAIGAAAAVTTAGRADAQQPFRKGDKGDKGDGKAEPKGQPKAGDPKVQPKVDPPKNPNPDLRPPVIGQPKAPPIIYHPQINGMPGLSAAPINRALFDPGPFYNPALNNPWMNQTRFIPTNPYANNPFNNPFAPNPFGPVNNPFAPNPFNNNPFAQNPFANPFNNPFANQFGPGAMGPCGPGGTFGCLGPSPFVSAPYSTYSPPMAYRMPGELIWRGNDLQVNPWSGLVYKPLSGVARTADGSVFYRVPGSGLPGMNSPYAAGSGLYFDPKNGTFLNPTSGVISKPGVTNVFLPYIP